MASPHAFTHRRRLGLVRSPGCSSPLLGKSIWLATPAWSIGPVKVLPDAFAADASASSVQREQAAHSSSPHSPPLRHEQDGGRLSRLELVEANAADGCGGRDAVEEAAEDCHPIAVLSTRRRARHVHRDRNRLTSRSPCGGQVLAFGLAKAMTAEASRAGVHACPRASTPSRLSEWRRRGLILGTAAYILRSSRRAARRSRSDLFSLLVLYEMRTVRQRSFRRDTPT